jgi:exosortase
MSDSPQSAGRPLSLFLGVLPGIALTVVWVVSLRMVWNDWRIDPQYSYGFLVPLLAIGLGLRRWEDRPAPVAPDRISLLIASGMIVLAAFSIALIIPVAEANPDWRPLGVAAALAACFLTLGIFFIKGGIAWLRHFAFPVLFLLIAVPWPRNFEQSVMASLMSWNTESTLEILHWCGYEAMRRGNLILIPSGVLGIEEACSGIRSLQSGLMVALFFGELFRLRILRRAYLLAIAVMAALLGNIFRSSLLAVVASSQGIRAVGAWHDPAGLMALMITVGMVFAVAFCWRGPARRSAIHNGESAPFGHRDVSGTLLSVSLVILIFLPGASLATELWFRSHERRDLPVLEWNLRSRHGEAGVTDVPIPPRTQRMLFFPQGFSEHWTLPEGDQGQVFYFRWPAGRTAAQALSMHNPEVCLSSIGMKLRRPLLPVTYVSSAVRLPFRAYLFEQQGRPVFVFHALLEDGGGDGIASESLDDTPSGRLQSVRAGRRNLGERMIEVAFWNLPDEVSARRSLRRYLDDAMSTTPVSSPMK